MAKYYAVAYGKTQNGVIYTSWDECKKEVIGCKGAIYKSFTSEEDAIQFIEAHGVEMKKYESEKSTKSKSQNNTLEIYVDGSFSIDKGNFSYGFVVVLEDNIIYEQNGVGNDKDAVALRNVSGEVLGAIEATKYAIEKGYSEIIIYFDYQGIQSWAIGTWKRNNKITINYHEMMKELMKKIDIKFIKVKGHSGNKYNDRADYLAKKALDLNI